MQVKIGLGTMGLFVVQENTIIAGVTFYAGTQISLIVDSIDKVIIGKTSNSVPFKFTLEEVKDLKIRDLYKNEPYKFNTQPYR